MKRFFTLIGFSALFSLFIALSFEYKFSLYFAIISGVILVVSAIRFKKTELCKLMFFISLTAVISFSGYYINYCINIEPITGFAGKDTYISGNLTEPVYKSSGKYYYVIKTEQVNETNEVANTKIRLSSSQALSIDVYDRIECKACFSDYYKDGSSNYLKSQGIYLSGFIYEYEDMSVTKATDKPFYACFQDLNQVLKTAFHEVLPDDCATLLCGLLLGDKHSLADDLTNNFRTAGLSHVLCVSGLHLSIITGFIYAFTRRITKRYKLAEILAMAVTVAFMAITGFSASIVRAGIMSLIYFMGLALNRQSDALNSLGLAVFVSCILNPFAGGNISLLLSSFSTLGIIVLYPKIYYALLSFFKINSKFLRFIIESLSLTISALIFTLPITVVTFGEFSVVSVLSNIVIVPLAMIALISAMLFLPFYFLSLPVLYYPFLYVGAIFSKLMSYLAWLFAQIPLALINFSQKYMIVCLLCGVILVAVLYIIGDIKKHLKTTAFLILIVFLVGYFTNIIAQNDKITLSVIASNIGSSLVLSQGDNSAVISCGGNTFTENKTETLLKSKSIQNIDLMLIPHSDKKVSAFSSDIIEKFMPKIIAVNKSMSFNSKISGAIKDKENIFYYRSDMSSKIFEDIKINVYTDNNKVFILLDIKGIRSLVIPMGGSIPASLSGYYDLAIIGDIPDNFNDIYCEYCIVSSDIDTSSILNAIYTISNAVKTIFTNEQGDINIDFYDNYKIVFDK